MVASRNGWPFCVRQRRDRLHGLQMDHAIIDHHMSSVRVWLFFPLPLSPPFPFVAVFSRPVAGTRSTSLTLMLCLFRSVDDFLLILKNIYERTDFKFNNGSNLNYFFIHLKISVDRHYSPC